MLLKHHRICCHCEERLGWSTVHCPRCNRLMPTWSWVATLPILSVVLVMALFKLIELVDNASM